MKIRWAIFIPFLWAGAAAAACFSTPGTPAGGDITLQATPSRVSGVAPLAVFFDSTGTVATASARTFHDLSYCWDFGDPGSGTFSSTGRSKNEMRGPVSGHVFETPGSYAVTLTARDSQGREAVRQLTITVQDPDVAYAGANTVCFSTSGDFTDCPAGAGTVTASNLSALQSQVATGRRLLLRRGESFTRDAAVNLNVPGPGTIGAFGAGARPVITAGSGAIFRAENSPNPRTDPDLSGWRIADLDIQGAGTSVGLSIGGRARNLLLLRVAMTGGQNFVNSDLNTFETDLSQDMVDGLFIQDCVARDIIEGYSLYASAHRLFFAGVRASVAPALARRSLVRLPWLDRAVLTDSEFGPGADGNGSTLYMPGPEFAPPPPPPGGPPPAPRITDGEYSQRILVSGNLLRSGDLVSSWTFQLGTNGGDKRFRDVVVERNLFHSGALVRTSLQVQGYVQGVSIRENLFQAFDDRCVELGAGNGDYPTDVSLSHNTCVGDDSQLVQFAPGSTGVQARNNLVVGAGSVLQTGSGVFAASSGNLVRTTAQAQLASANPVAWGDFMPQAGSPAVGAGDPSFTGTWDHASGQRTDGAPDAGALERGAGGPPPPPDLVPPAAPRGLRAR